MVTKPLSDTPIGILVCTIVYWLAWAYFCTWVTSNFHKTKYHKKIKEILFYWYIIEALSGRPWTEIQHMANPKKTSARNMKKVKKGLTVKIRTESEARVAAKRLFKDVAKPGSEFIELEDLARFLPQNDALVALSMFDVKSEGETTRISCSFLQHWMVYTLRLERSLVLSMEDTDSIISSVRIAPYLFASVSQVLALVPVLLGLEGTRLALYSFLVLLVFLPIMMCKEATSFFDSLGFIFFLLPYDVGEICEIDKVEFVVKKINFTSTTFVGLDNKEYQMSSRSLLPKGFKTFVDSSRLDKIGLILSSRFEGKDASSSDSNLEKLMIAV